MATFQCTKCQIVINSVSMPPGGGGCSGNNGGMHFWNFLASRIKKCFLNW